MKEGLINLINLTFYHDLDPIGVIGLSCSSSEYLLSNVAIHIGKNLTVISSSGSLTCNHRVCASTYYYRILQSTTVLLDAFHSLAIHLGWNRIAIVTDSADQHFSVAESLHDSATASKAYNIITFIQLRDSQPLTLPFQELQRFNSKIIFLSTNIIESIKILCTAKKKGFTWPDYAWIIHSITFDDFVASEHVAVCNIYDALEGIILLEHHLKSANNALQMGYTYSEYFRKYNEKLANLSAEMKIELRPNIYANLLHDSIWVYALALHSKVNSSGLHVSDYVRNTDLNGTIGRINFRQNAEARTGVDILQVRNSSAVYIGHYNPSWKNISFTDSLLNNPVPSDGHTILSDKASLLYTSFLSLLVVICTILVTLILMLFIQYRKEPEIKSTSVTLSLLMFIGCYIILVYLLLAILYTQSLVPSTSLFNICTALGWLSISGIPMPLILATLLVKMLRVFRIFTFYGKIGRMCSDVALLIYVLLLISPCALILIFWSTIDPYTAKDVVMEYPHFTKIEQRCFSKYLLVWIGFSVVNITILIVVLITVAVKTRKIRQAHFKDTKKVNIFLFILLTMIFVTFSYWMLFRTIGANKGYSDITLHIAHIIIVASCQGFLFVPKILPPLQRSISKRYKLKGYTSNSSSKAHSTTITLTTNQQ